MTSDRELPEETPASIRRGEWSELRHGSAAGYSQANLVVLAQVPALEVLLPCQRNPRASRVVKGAEVREPQPELMVKR